MEPVTNTQISQKKRKCSLLSTATLQDVETCKELGNNSSIN